MTTSTVTIESIVAALNAKVHTPELDLDRPVSSACASDLMSDVLAFSKPKSILLTGLNTPQTIRTADVADIVAVCLTFGKAPSEDTVRLAVESNIPLISTALSLFSAGGRLFVLGLCGCVETK